MKRIIAIGFAIGLVWGLAYSVLPAPHLAPRHWSFGATAALAGHPPPPAWTVSLACSPNPGTQGSPVTCTETSTGCTTGDDLEAINFQDGSAGTDGNGNYFPTVEAGHAVQSYSHTFAAGTGFTVLANVECPGRSPSIQEASTSEGFH